MSKKRTKLKWSKLRRQILYDMFNGKCAYCERDMDLDNFELEHFDPYCKTRWNGATNIFPAHRECNQIKGTLEFQDMAEAKAYICGKLGITLEPLPTLLVSPLAKPQIAVEPIDEAEAARRKALVIKWFG